MPLWTFSLITQLKNGSMTDGNVKKNTCCSCHGDLKARAPFRRPATTAQRVGLKEKKNISFFFYLFSPKGPPVLYNNGSCLNRRRWRPYIIQKSRGSKMHWNSGRTICRYFSSGARGRKTRANTDDDPRSLLFQLSSTITPPSLSPLQRHAFYINRFTYSPPIAQHYRHFG